MDNYHLLDIDKQNFIGAEPDDGNIEYKLQIIDLENNRLEKFKTQLLWRVREGHGNAIYYIGVSDKGVPLGISVKKLNESIINIKNVAKSLNMEAVLNNIKFGIFPKRYCAQFTISSLCTLNHVHESIY